MVHIHISFVNITFWVPKHNVQHVLKAMLLLEININKA